MSKKHYLQPTVLIKSFAEGNVLRNSTDNLGYWKDDWFKGGLNYE